MQAEFTDLGKDGKNYILGFLKKVENKDLKDGKWNIELKQKMK